MEGIIHVIWFCDFEGIINLRNEMAYYLSQQIKGVTSEDGHVTYSLGRLPEPINNPRACSKCPQLLNCALYQKYEFCLDLSRRPFIPNTICGRLGEPLIWIFCSGRFCWGYFNLVWKKESAIKLPSIPLYAFYLILV